MKWQVGRWADKRYGIIAHLILYYDNSTDTDIRRTIISSERQALVEHLDIWYFDALDMEPDISEWSGVQSNSIGFHTHLSDRRAGHCVLLYPGLGRCYWSVRTGTVTKKRVGPVPGFFVECDSIDTPDYRCACGVCAHYHDATPGGITERTARDDPDGDGDQSVCISGISGSHSRTDRSLPYA